MQLRRYLETVSCLSLVLAAGFVVGGAGSALANPEDGVIASGSATITSPNAGKLDINQTSNNVVIDWRSFDIAPNEHTQFYQPNSSSTALNRVNSPNASQILGKLSANGNVIIVNQAGVMFGKDAVVDVNGLVATTSDITNTNFMNGNLLFDKAGNPNGAIVNSGTITAKDAGLVGLVAPRVTNSGTITAKLGKVQLASGDKFSVDLYGDGLMNITLSDDVSTQLVENSGTIKAEGGTIEMTAAAGAHVVNSLINISGELSAPSISNKDGKITISGNGTLLNTGTISTNSTVTGTKAGSINIKSKKISNQGKITADSTSTGAAGSITINFDEAYLDSESAITSAKGTNTKGGAIKVTGKTGSHAFISGTYDVSSTLNNGGTATITADAGDLKLYGAHVNANGKTGGGTINIGGEYQGTGTTAHASTTGINYATYLSANATDTGNGGNIIVWSDDTTKFAGHASAKGGQISGNGGLIELSSKDTLQVAPNADTVASAAHGQAGSLLLDPKNIIIQTGGITGGISSFEFIDPNPDGGDFSVDMMLMTSNGNLFITDKNDDTMATDAGAIYLFNGATGALISSLYGSSAGDQIGFEAGGYFMQYDLRNNNYVFVSQQWDNAGVVNAGAVTFVNGTTGLSGLITASNSLVGVQAADFDNAYVTVLDNHNYVIGNGAWDNGAIVDAGATTWGSGTTGVSGIISSSNSYVGSTAGDAIGDMGITALTNGNYVLRNYNWDNGSIVDAGAVTWGNGTTGSSGVIDVSNSIVGDHAYDYVGDDQVTALANGNFLTASRSWDNGGVINAGFVYIGDGTTVNAGVVSAANSIVGSSLADEVGLNIYILSNGKIAIGSYYWDDGATVNAGALRIVDPTHASATGALDASNSLIGAQANDMIGYSGVYDLKNGAIVVGSSAWNNGGTLQVGAVTWMDTSAPLVGTVTAANSLVGATANDGIGSTFLVLSNGNYLVGSSSWDNGGIVDAGAVTWGNGTTGTIGTVDTSNSLYGMHTNDHVGGFGLYELGTSGNYAIHSATWDNGAVTDAGALTWGNGTTGSAGAISSANSLVGSTTDDLQYGSLLCSGSTVCLFGSRGWDNGSTVDAGAIIVLSSAGFSGVIDSTNALVGTQANDQIGDYIIPLTNGNYIIQSSVWDDGSVVDAGALTWINGTTGLTGTISSSNSMLGSTSGDFLSQYVRELGNNYFEVETLSYDNGSVVDGGAASIFSSTGPVTGYMDASNSLVGNVTGDITGDTIYLINATEGFIMNNSYDHGSDVDAGALTYFDLAGVGLTGNLDESKSIFGNAGSGFYYSYIEDTTHGRYIAQFVNEKRVISFGFGATLLDFDSYSDNVSSTITIDPTFITNVLNAGTAVTLQASNDITINDDIIVSAGGGGGTLTFQAGRSLLINANITTDNGNLNIFANEKLSTGVINAQRDAGAAVITMANGTIIDAGTGDVNIRLDDGAGKTNHSAGDITLRTVTANTITAVNRNSTGDIILASGGALTATATTGDSIVLASARNFINNIGASALNVTGSARWLSYSTNAINDTIGSLSAGFSLFACTYGGSCGTLGSGNGFLYSFDPNAPIGGSTTTVPVPPTVLYVSQTPPVNIIYGGASNGGTRSVSSDKSSKDYLTTEPQDIAANQPYSLFNGWIIIDPTLVKKLNLIWSMI